MRLVTQSAAVARSRAVYTRPLTSSRTAGFGRTAAYRRIGFLDGLSQTPKAPAITFSSIPTSTSILRRLHRPTHFQPPLSRPAANTIRHFHSRNGYLQQNHQKAEDEVKAKPDKEPSETEGRAEAGGKSEGESNSKEQQEGEAQKENKSEEEKTAPPPHGDKTPWQVFTETLSTEFKKSKEWNESTKQLASGYQEFTQNENLKRVHSAYSKASDAAATTTSAALKGTGRVLGHSAAWVWETPVVKGVRVSANATGRGIEKITRPVRETEAFKNVKEVIDDGSSSRYGGWIEKEERQRRRELREAKEAMMHGGQKPTEPVVEDPK